MLKIFQLLENFIKSQKKIVKNLADLTKHPHPLRTYDEEVSKVHPFKQTVAIVCSHFNDPKYHGRMRDEGKKLLCS